jgi:hypothetical protein
MPRVSARAMVGSSALDDGGVNMAFDPDIEAKQSHDSSNSI